MMGTMRTTFATVAGTVLLVWWTADALGLLGADLASRQQTVSHSAAELLLGCALLFGGWLQRREARKGRLVLAGAFGGLAYASVNVMDDYAAQPGMLVVLALAFVLSLLALASLLNEVR